MYAEKTADEHAGFRLRRGASIGSAEDNELEQCLEFIADDELLEVTPNPSHSQAYLEHAQRMKAVHLTK
jgi:predicted membrane GTPase involved in stress response